MGWVVVTGMVVVIGALVIILVLLTGVLGVLICLSVIIMNLLVTGVCLMLMHLMVLCTTIRIIITCSISLIFFIVYNLVLRPQTIQVGTILLPVAVAVLTRSLMLRALVSILTQM